MTKNAVVFLAWGDKYIQEVASCIRRSRHINCFDLILITDENTSLGECEHSFSKIVRTPFKMTGFLRKTEMINHLPNTYDSYLFLDSDTIVIEDISLGFRMAEKFDIAVSPAPHYSLDYFWGFDRIMKLEKIDCLGQLQYNTGVIFFKNSIRTHEIFNRWSELAFKHQAIFTNDQPFFSLAMEQLNFNPYTLSISYNYRGFGDNISGIVRIWHSHGELPPSINDFEKAWPPRRAWPSKIEFSQ